MPTYGSGNYGGGTYGDLSGDAAAHTLQVESAVRGRVAAPIGLASPNDLTEPIAARLVTRTRSTLAELTTLDHEWEDPVGEPGSARVTIWADDPAVALLDEGLLIEHRLDGELAFTSLVESWRITEIADPEQGPARQVCEITGRGLLAALEWAVVYPSTGVGRRPPEIDRVFDWTSPGYPDSSWARARVISNVRTLGPFWALNPTDWPDPQGQIIWDPRGTTQTAPVGFVYFRRNVTIPADGEVLIYVSSDGPDTMWIDGRLVHENKNPGQGLTDIFVIRQELDAGQHTIAVRVENRAWRWPGSNPAGLLVAGLEFNEETGGPGQLLFRSDGNWRIVGYPPSPPGMTPGQVVRLLLAEAHDRGTIPFLSAGFSDQLDSAGQPWPDMSNLATKVGTDYLTFFAREMAAHYMDLWVEPGTGVLRAWVKGGRGRQRSGVNWVTAPIDEVEAGHLTWVTREFG